MLSHIAQLAQEMSNISRSLTSGEMIFGRLDRKPSGEGYCYSATVSYNYTEAVSANKSFLVFSRITMTQIR